MVVEAFDLVERDHGLASGDTVAERKNRFKDGIYPGLEETKVVTERMMSVLNRIGKTKLYTYCVNQLN